MNNYNFSTLNDKEFEQICKELLNAKFGLGLQDFKVGKDKGVDLRFSSKKNNNSIVVQAKHYIGSKYAQLKHTLKEKEYNKIKLLNPDRYIVTTSLSLSAQEKDELKDILSPYVQTSNDIISQENLNEYLSDNESIETKYFKLWFSSINVFRAVLNNAIENRTKYLLERIQRNFPYYVVTKKLDEANKILTKEKLLLITGQPGIGKTTLAELVILNRAKDDFKIYKVENIKEAEDVISPSDDEKQLFYFDDFLGANYVEIINAHKTETQLTSFVERIKHTPNKFLILTTRTVILNQAIEKYEKISHSKLGNEKFEIKLTDYSKYEKALILYNHLFFKDVKEEFFDKVLEEKFYFEIIQHRNYTPRIIEFITDKSKINSFTKEQYKQYILNNLNNPKEIWRYSFNNQIDYMDRCLLITIFSFQNGCTEKHLMKSFESRLEHEKEAHNQVVQSNQFNESIKILLDGFISSQLTDIEKDIRYYSFINPSLNDFFIGHISESFQERKSIISSFVYIEQIQKFNPILSVLPLEKELQLVIRDKISKNAIEFVEEEKPWFNENRKNVLLLEVLCKYCKDTNIDKVLLEYFKLLDLTKGFAGLVTKLDYVLDNIGDSPMTFEYIKTNFIQIIESLMSSNEDSDVASNIPSLFEKYEVNYTEYIETDNGFNKILDVIGDVLGYNEDSLKDEKQESAYDYTIVDEIYDELYDLENDLKTVLFPDTDVSYDFGITPDSSYWDEKIQENIGKSEYEESQAEAYYEDYYREDRSVQENEENAINELFTKQI